MTLIIRDEARGTDHQCPPGRPIIVGRGAATPPPDIACENKHVSRKHCELTAEPDGLLRVKDLSTYGTFINDRRVDKEGFAQPGDRIRLGHDYVLRVVAPARTSESTVTSYSPTVLEKPGAATPAPATAPVPVLADPPLAEIGTRYKVLREIGRGGMGAVYEAVDRTTGARCALKRLLKVARADQEIVERFRREAMLGAKLGRHDGIVSVFDTGTIPETGELYFAMDLVAGESLKALLRKGLDRWRGLAILAATARAVAYAHERGVIHRDLKPENVLVTADWEPRLTDFGIAKATGGAPLTMTGTTMGTPSYMAPEQFDDFKRVTPAADVYALGAMLYEVLTGGPPYTGKQVSDIIAKVTAGKLVPPREKDDTIEPTLDELCRRALALDPADRLDSAATLAAALEAWLRRGDTEAPP